MKPLFTVILLLSLLPALPAQEAPLDPSGAVVADVRLTREQLKELTGPIALYPDPLVALILPASTFPSDVVLAARFLQSGEDPALADEKPWDESIRGLTRYPDVLTWMDENLEWTTQLGYAYLAQPEDVMDSIQELRGQAQSLGNLVDTPQQRVVREETYIRIVPAEPEYIYVPYYDPEIVYYERPIAEPYLTFSIPWLVGTWLTFDFDWHRHRLYCGDWHGDWDYHHRRDRHDHRGEPIFINNSFTNYEIWRGDSRRRLGSTRNFTEIRDRLRQSTLAAPTFFQERFDVRERERRAVPVKAEVRERDRKDAVGEVTKTRQLDRERFSADGRIRSRDGDKATLTQIAEREQARVAAETKRREEVRARLAAEGKISERDRDGRMRGAGGKMGERGKAGPDGRVTERPPVPGQPIKPGDAPKIGERGKMDNVPKEGERGKGRVTTPPSVTERPPVPGDDGKGKSKEGERGKSGVAIPRGAPPSVTGEMRPDKRGSEDEAKGKGKGKDADRGPTGRTEIPKAELPKGRPDAKDIPKAELPKGRPEAKEVPRTELPKGRPETKDLPKADLPKGRPEVKERPTVTPVPGTPGDPGAKSKGKGKSIEPGPRNEAPRIERPTPPKSDPTPRVTPQPRPEVPKTRPQPPANIEPPRPKVQPQQPPSVRPAPPEKKKDQPTARRTIPDAPKIERQPAPQRPAATAPRPQPQRPAASHSRPAAPPQAINPPKSPRGGGGKTPQDDDEKKKGRR